MIAAGFRCSDSGHRFILDLQAVWELQLPSESIPGVVPVHEDKMETTAERWVTPECDGLLNQIVNSVKNPYYDQ